MQEDTNTNWLQDYSATIEAGTAKSTHRAYARDVIYFWAWAKLALDQSEQYPVSEETVIRFVMDHQMQVLGTLQSRHQIGLGQMHRLRIAQKSFLPV